MASITNYSQPDFYHFSRDSIELANAVAEHVDFHELVIDNVADLCCGCGVVALEVIQKLEKEYSDTIKEVHFVELQDDYLPYIQQNIEQIKKDFKWIDYQIHLNNILDSKFEKGLDLIVMNPPYFKEGHGRTSDNEKKKVCREYTGDDFSRYIEHGASLLNSNGVLFFVCREDEQVKGTISNLTKKYFIERIEEEKGFSIFLLLRSKLH